MTPALPSLFLSHGSPMIAVDPGAAGRFMQALGPALTARYGRPQAVLVMSPHTATRQPLLLAGSRHHAVHDFGGFPSALYALTYDAPSAPDLARHAAALLTQAGIAVRCLDGADGAGLDHGIWTVLRHLWPQADVPVLPLSLVPDWTARQAWTAGAALAPLRHEGVLLIGSGSLTHNLRRYFSRLGPGMVADTAAPADADTIAFRDWVHGRVQADDWAALLDWDRLAPSAATAHPTDEHWLPFHFAAGSGVGTADTGQVAPGARQAAGDAAHAPADSAHGRRLHASLDAGSLAMDAYAFGTAQELAPLADFAVDGPAADEPAPAPGPRAGR